MPREFQQQLELGVGILKTFRGQNTNWLSWLKEWIDNSLGARAKTIRFKRVDDCLDVIDDGDGCDDLMMMQSPARSHHFAHNQAGMYGVGGVMAQIKASDYGPVEVISVHKNWESRLIVDWNECIENDDLKTKEYARFKPTPDLPTGTTIRIHHAKRFGSVDRFIKELGHDYAGELKRGKSIIFEINGQTQSVEPFKPPLLECRVDFDLEFQGHKIKGFTGIVKTGVNNSYSGWSVHWGYRFAFRTAKPGNGATNRIYGEVHLPKSWQNITPTKDNFSDDADDLWEKINELCADIIKQAQDQSVDLELSEASEIAGELLTMAIAGEQQRVKGRRPSSAGKNGTVSPTGEGSEHHNFTKDQPGERPVDRDGVPLPAKMPSRIKIAWDETLDNSWDIAISGTRKTTMTITLNKSRQAIHDFKSDPSKLATLCCFPIAHELDSNPRFAELLPMFKAETFRETYDNLLARIAAAPAEVPA